MSGIINNTGARSGIIGNTTGKGTWQGTAVADEYGGTGQTTYAQGDILYASASNTLSKLVKGSDNHVLTMNGNVPNWEAASGGGGGGSAGLVFIDQDTVSGGSEAIVEGMDSTYKTYLVTGETLVSAVDNVQGQMQFYAGSWQASNYGYSRSTYIGGSSWVNANSSSFSHMCEGWLRDCGNNSYEGGSYNLWIYNPANTATYTGWSGMSISSRSGTTNGIVAVGMWKGTTAVTKVRSYFSSGSFSGTIRLYGLATS